MEMKTNPEKKERKKKKVIFQLLEFQTLWGWE